MAGAGRDAPSREAVVWTYRLILGREPESEAVVEAKLRGHATVAEPRAALFDSAEFRAGSARTPPRRADRAEPGAALLRPRRARRAGFLARSPRDQDAP